MFLPALDQSMDIDAFPSQADVENMVQGQADVKANVKVECKKEADPAATIR